MADQNYIPTSVSNFHNLTKIDRNSAERIPNATANTAVINNTKLISKNANYRPAVFFRKPVGYVRYRHGGYNSLFPPLSDDVWQVLANLYQGSGESSLLALLRVKLTEENGFNPNVKNKLGQLLPFVKPQKK